MISIRRAVPADYDRIIGVVDEWWGGRKMQEGLPRLFLDHFHRTSLVAEDEHGELAGFLVGFVSPSQPEVGYVHYVAVNPARRSGSLGRDLYEQFEVIAEAAGCRELRCVTSPINRASIAFHQRIGFSVLPGHETADEVPYSASYDGPGEDRVRFVRAIQSRGAKGDEMPVEGH